MKSFKFTVFLLAQVVAWTSGRPISAQTQAPQEPLQLTVKSRGVYWPGLPVGVDIGITNVSTSVQRIRAPAMSQYNLGYVLKKVGALKPREITVNYEYPPPSNKLTPLKPGEQVEVAIDLNTYFRDPIPTGSYVCQIRYSGGPGKTMLSPWTLITIAEPVHQSLDLQRDLRLSMVKYLAAVTYKNDGNYELARLIFRDIANSDMAFEYARCSNYYLALLEKEPSKAAEAVRQVTSLPPHSFRGLSDMNDLQRMLGIKYFDAGDYKSAKEAFLKIPRPDAYVQKYLKDIEAKSKTSP